MTPYYADPWLSIYGGDCREVMATLPAESVHCVVTSPPYFGLRDYESAGQLGLERTVAEYVAAMVEVFRSVRRVMRDDATLWLVLGDSFLPGKQLAGIPWRVAFALQADGWYLRSDIVWSKPNPMPESVTDRPTKSHEYLFLLSKSPRYYFDADAVREDVAPSQVGRVRADVFGGSSWQERQQHSEGAVYEGGTGRNLRSVWTIATAPYPGAHFATFPPKLVEPCIKAGTSEKGVCPECGAPWRRVVERTNTEPQRVGEWKATGEAHRNDIERKGGFYTVTTPTGWRPSCGCVRDIDELEPVPATVLDPFAGSGTALMVAQSLSRRAIGIDLNPAYLAQCLERNRDIPLGLGA